MGGPHESDRLAVLDRLGLLDTAADEAFDRLTRLATRTLRVPVALVVLVGDDRQVFKGAAGLREPWVSRRETPLSHSFCRHEITSGEPLVVDDAREHPLLRDNLAIPDLGVIAYAGIPLRAPGGPVLGSFCAIDYQPRAWTGEDLAILADLAAAAMTEIELRAVAREAGRAVERVGRLQAATAALAGALTPDAVAAVAVEQGVAALGAHAGLVALLTSDEATLEIVQAAGYPPHLVEAWRRIPLAAPVPLAEAVRTKTPLWFASPAELTARYPSLAATVSGFSGVHPLTAIPLVVDERAVGVLGLAFPDARAFDAEDRALMLALAGQCAQALERARLYEAEQAARAAAEEAVRQREHFVSIASHELRTPLTSLVGFMQLLQRQLAHPARDYERFTRYVEQCRQQVDRLRTLVDDLLVASRSQQGRLDLRPEAFDLAALAAEIRERFEHAPERTARHTLALEAPAPVGGLWDRDRLDQVLTNLVSNALKYSPAGGRVLVRVTRCDDEAEVAVSDEGLGIPADEQASLFQPFVRASTPNAQISGTGLGLYIVRQIAEAHGGTVNLHSAVGRGTTITVRLPLETPAALPDGTGAG